MSGQRSGEVMIGGAALAPTAAAASSFVATASAAGATAFAAAPFTMASTSAAHPAVCSAHEIGTDATRVGAGLGPAFQATSSLKSHIKMQRGCQHYQPAMMTPGRAGRV